MIRRWTGFRLTCLDLVQGTKSDMGSRNGTSQIDASDKNKATIEKQYSRYVGIAFIHVWSMGCCPETFGYPSGEKVKNLRWQESQLSHHPKFTMFVYANRKSKNIRDFLFDWWYLLSPLSIVFYMIFIPRQTHQRISIGGLPFSSYDVAPLP